MSSPEASSSEAVASMPGAQRGASPGSLPIHLVVNCASGSGAGREVAAAAREHCAQAGRELTLHMPGRPRALDGLAREVVAEATRTGAMVCAAGGDGTIRTVAQELCGSSVPLGVIPLGTYNFFARNYGIPEVADDALRIMLNGVTRPVDLGHINGELFLINASLGLYSDLIKAREEHVSRWGRNRLVATTSTVFSLLKGYEPLEIDLVTEGSAQRIRTPMVFVGNNALQLRAVALDVARCAQQGQLAVVIMEPLEQWGMMRLACYGLARKLQREGTLHSFCTDTLIVGCRRRFVEVVLDGERMRLATPLSFQIQRGALNLIVAPDAVRERGDG